MGGQACGFLMTIRHAPQIAGFRGEGVPISGTLHHGTSAFKLGANHQLKFGHKFFAQSLQDLNAVLVKNVVMISPHTVEITDVTAQLLQTFTIISV